MIETPRQLSANGEHGFPIASKADKVRVTLNGESRRAIIAYDMVAGWVESINLDDNGMPLHRDGEYFIKREYGKITAVILG